MSSELDKGEGCTVPGTAGSSLVEKQKDLACILCGGMMHYAEEFRVNLCLNSKEHVKKVI